MLLFIYLAGSTSRKITVWQHCKAIILQINQSIHLEGNLSVGTCLQLPNLDLALISISAAIDNYLMVPLRPERADTLS